MARMLDRTRFDPVAGDKFDYVSVHIPKCGGTTMVRMLNAGFGSRLFLDPEYFPKKRSLIRRSVIPRRNPGGGGTGTCIHGHFPASVHWRPGATMFTTVRDPAERALSNWRYIERLAAEPKQGKKAWVRQAAGRSLEQVATEIDPVLRHFLDLPLDRFAMICDQGELDRDLSLLAGMLDCGMPDQRSNSAPSPTVVDPEFRKAYEARNAEEVRLYEAALDRREHILATRRSDLGRTNST